MDSEEGKERRVVCAHKEAPDRWDDVHANVQFIVEMLEDVGDEEAGDGEG